VTTPIIMLVLMTAPYLLVRILSVARRSDFDTRAAAAIGLGLLFAFTGIGHFIRTGPMAQMLPPWVPQQVALVYLSGILELAIAVGFFVPKSRQFTGWVAAAVLVSFFPVNIYAAINHVPMGGHAWGLIFFSSGPHFRLSSCCGYIGSRSGTLTRHCKRRTGELQR
jgi:uncharacterized membrane protein